MSETEVVLYTPMGVPVASINPAALIASHILNDVGDCTFTLSLEDYHAKEEFLQFGNFVVVNHSTLPSWVGMIDPQQGRQWGAGTISLSALSAEKIFEKRYTFPFPFVGTNGGILRQVLERVNVAPGGIKIYPGEIYMGGLTSYYPRLAKARDVMDRLARKGKCDWSVTHRVVDGLLRLYVNLYKGERGERTDVVLDARNTELFEPIYAEEGEIYNHVQFYKPPREGEGGLKISRVWRDEKSISKYGLSMYCSESMGEEEALDWQARAWLYDHAYPHGNVMPTLLDVGDTFASVGLGNIYRWENHGIKFNGALVGVGDDVRMEGFEVDYFGNKVNATVASTNKPFDITALFNET